MRERLRGIRYLLADVGYAIGRVPRAVARGGEAFWRSLPAGSRWRLALVGAAVVVLGVAFAVAGGDGDDDEPVDEADDLVPAEALAYVHLDLGGDQFDQVAELAKGLPELTDRVRLPLLSMLPGPRGGTADFERQIEPWFGGEAAIAVLPATGAPEQVYLLEVDDSEGAAKYAESLFAGRPETEDRGGVELQTDERGVAAAEVGGFLAIGTDDAVRSVIDVETDTGYASPLAADETADEIRAELPGSRLADVYVSEEGVAELVAADRGAFGSLAPLVDAGSSRGAAAAVVAGDDGLELTVRSSLDPERAESDPGFFTAFPSFQPDLAAEVPDDALAYLGLGDPSTTFADLLVQASSDAPGIVAGFSDLAERLRDIEEVDLRDEFLPALAGESAVAIVPGAPVELEGEEVAPDGTVPPPEPPEGQPPPTATQPGTPYLEAIVDDVDEETATGALGALEEPIAEAVGPPEGSDELPEFDKREFGDVEARSIEINPAIELTYALLESRLVVATAPEGVKRAVEGEGGLDEASEFERATDGFPGEVSLLVFLDLAGLIEFAEREQLGADQDYARIAPELRSLEALGVAVSAGEDSLATDARLLIGELQEEQTAAPPAPGD